MSSANKGVVATYISLVALWAFTPLAIVWSVAEIPVFWSLLLRFLFALPLLLLILFGLGIRLPLHRTALHSYLAGSFSLVVSQSFTYMATAYLSSGMIALMFGFAPIVAGLMGFLLYRKRLYPIQWLGMAISITGLYMISVAGRTVDVSVTGLLLMGMATVCYASSIYWVKHVNAKVEPIAQATGSVAVSALLALLYIPLIWHDLPQAMPGVRSLVALGYTTVGSTVVAMFCYFRLMQSVSATTISLATVVTPMLAIFIGIMLNNEPFNINILFGSFIVISGLVPYFYRDLRALKLQHGRRVHPGS